MCLRKKVGTLDSYVADTYTTVFKVLDSGDKSLWRGFQYAHNETYGPVKLGVTPCRDTETLVHEGFHAYLTLDRACRELRLCSTDHYGAKVVAFTIPAGARYILGDDDDIVCDTIVSSPWQPK
jgi:hypothetical protein